MARPKNIANIYNPPKSNTQFSEGQKSKGILDDYGERQNVSTKEGTIEHTPTLDKHIVNKEYVDTEVAAVTPVDHTDSNDVSNVGTNTHFVIDSHIASNVNPHTVTLQQATDAGTTTDNEIEITSTGGVTPSLKFTNDAETAEIFQDTNQNLVFASFSNFQFKTTDTAGGTHTVPFFNNDLNDRKRDMIFHIYGDGSASGSRVEITHMGDAGNALIKTGRGKFLFENSDATGGFEFIPANRTDMTLNIHGSEQVAVGNVVPTNKFSVNEKASMSPIGGFCVMLTNKSGANTVAGDIVVASVANNDAVIKATANSVSAIGVFLDSGVSDGSEAWVVIGGKADVHMDAGGAVRGDRIITSATIGRGDVNNSPATAVHFQEIGHCTETVGANGTARCVLHFN